MVSHGVGRFMGWHGANWGSVLRQMACKPGSVPMVSHRRRPFIWDARYRTPHATDPGGYAKVRLASREREGCRPYLVLLPVGFTVPLPLPVARCALTAPFHPYPPGPDGPKGGRFAFCGTFPGVAPAGRYPAPYFRGARTFLPQAKRMGAAVRPSGAGAMWGTTGVPSRSGLAMALFRSRRSCCPSGYCSSSWGCLRC